MNGKCDFCIYSAPSQDHYESYIKDIGDLNFAENLFEENHQLKEECHILHMEGRFCKFSYLEVLKIN